MYALCENSKVAIMSHIKYIKYKKSIKNKDNWSFFGSDQRRDKCFFSFNEYNVIERETRQWVALAMQGFSAAVYKLLYVSPSFVLI